MSCMIFYILQLIKRESKLLLQKQQTIHQMNIFLNGQDEEWNRIGNILHDRLGAKLSAVLLHLNSVKTYIPNEKFENISILLNDAVKETRKISRDIAKPEILEDGIMPAIKELALENSNKNIDIQVNCNESKIKLENRIKLIIYKIVQQLVNKVIELAQASIIKINLQFLNDKLHILITDNGAETNSSSNYNNIENIINQVNSYNGSFNMSRQNGENCMLILFPISV